MPTPKADEDSEARLITIAARLADRGVPSSDEFLRRFRRYYRHLAVSSGQRFAYIDLDAADRETEKALGAKP